MKTLIALSLLSLPALGAWFSGEGKFVAAHDISFLSYADKKECEADKGRWENELCVFAAEDELEITRQGVNYTAKVSTVTTNAHTCDFEGQGAFQNDGTLKVSAESQEWNAEKEEWIPATCEVTVSFEDGDTANVSNNGKCQMFCGMRATLDITKAKRAE